MPVDHIRYDILTQAALRSVLRTVLADVAKKGLPGEHHFKISFDTNAEGVKLSPRMHAQYPEEMTIVLQHQFWDLTVTEDAFEVGLSFGGIPERLRVPFDAVNGFVDPAVQFGLQFETLEVTDEDAETDATPAETKAGPPKASVPASPLPPPPSPVAGSEPAAPADNEKASAEVVRLDRFRKK
jgi:hypothetical protein